MTKTEANALAQELFSIALAQAKERGFRGKERDSYIAGYIDSFIKVTHACAQLDTEE